jgi:hypothetical protein
VPATAPRDRFYLLKAEQVRIWELAAYLANEGFRASDFQVIKAALPPAQPDKRLLAADQRIRGADQRYKQEAFASAFVSIWTMVGNTKRLR